MRRTVGFLLAAVLAALVLASPASAAGSFTTTQTVDPTVIHVGGYTFTVSGTVTADVTPGSRWTSRAI